MLITIPARLQEKLHSDSTYEGYIYTLLNNTASLITEKAVFFPEYTIHGWTHIQAVLYHADKLIPDVTMEALSGRDAALLIAAAVLHDLGMFLNKVGVRKLLTGPRRTAKTARLDKLDWKSEWDRYIQEIRRYPEEKLLYHFGMSHAIEEPDLEKGEFSDLDLLIVGDFLRRHHHRIAHEIALGTMPGDTDIDVLRVGTDALGSQAFNPKDRKCIGILARSHGMSIRETRDYIDREVGRQYKEKLTYLMAVLRIADALDADEQRAPDTVRKLQGIRIPVSVKEWTWNQRIVRTELDWNEGVDYKYVEAEPESTTEFVHLEGWLKWVQRELDTCWAVLSEVCDTQKYRLSIHRIESNILEEERRESYDEKFITKDARLNANPELLKLLVGPLYDDDPSCGVREMLQNAVDACNERAHLEGEGYRGQVEIRLNTQAKTLTVTDNGIGMDENVLLNYYLSAGASYRTSDQWFEQFATDRDPNIVRTGRFGVGVLATFLLGHQVKVTTRHMDDDFGYTFEFGLEPKALDIKRPEVQPEIGTTITVMMKEDALKKLLDDYKDKKKWLNWYRFPEPAVMYWVDGVEYVSDKPFVPQDDREVPGWFELPGTGLELAQWGYPNDGFFCNGIRINNAMPLSYPYRDCQIIQPSVSMIDPKSMLPLNLARTALIQFKQRKYLKKEVEKFFLATLLTLDWSSDTAAGGNFQSGIPFVKSTAGNTIAPFICTKEGYTILGEHILQKMRDSRFLVFHPNHNTDYRELASAIYRLAPTVPFIVSPSPLNTDSPKGELTRIFSNKFSDNLMTDSRRTGVSRVWVRKDFAGIVESKIWHVKNHFSIGRITDSYLEYLHGAQTAEGYLFDLPRWNADMCVAISEKEWKTDRFTKKTGLIGKLLHTYMAGDPWIPYDMDARREKFPKAFEELKYYIDRILADREKERGAQDA